MWVRKEMDRVGTNNDTHLDQVCSGCIDTDGDGQIAPESCRCTGPFCPLSGSLECSVVFFWHWNSRRLALKHITVSTLCHLFVFELLFPLAITWPFAWIGAAPLPPQPVAAEMSKGWANITAGHNVGGDLGGTFVLNQWLPKAKQLI